MTKRLIRLLETAVIALVLAMLPQPAAGCSLVSCIDHGIEVAGDLAVLIKHEGKPLRGVSVEIKTNTPDQETVVIARVTDFEGAVHMTKLPPGDYWLSAEFLGIGAAYHCFHVDRRPSRKAKRVLAYKWGDIAPATQQIAGTLIDSQPSVGGTLLWNITHRVEVPISGAILRLRNAITEEAFSTTSDKSGLFNFGAVQNGTYVLHIEGGQTGRGYDPTDLLVKVSAVASRRTLVLTRQESNCGNAPLILSSTKSP